MRTAWARGAACSLGVLSILLAMVDCTAITSETNGQCLSDSDCRNRGAAFANTRCSAVGVCEGIKVPDVNLDGGVSCQTNAECNALLSTAARCASGTCVALTNGNCTVTSGDPNAPNARYVGVMTPRTGVNAQYGLNQYAVVTSAAAEWNSATAGQPDARPIVTIGCDELADPGGTSTFLATRLGVSTIFGPVYDINFAKAVAAANLSGTILVGPRANDPTMATYEGIGKTIWSQAPSRSIQARFLNNLVTAITPSVKASQSVTGDMRVALLVATGEDTSSANFAASVEQTLTFNGKSISANGASYKRVDVPVSFSTANKYVDAIAALVAATPDLVIVTQEYDLAALALAVNNGWTGPRFPRFVFFTEDPAVSNAVILPNQRFAGKLDLVTWSRSAQEVATASTFAVGYRTATGADPAPFSELLYDGFYANLYATQAVLNANGNSLGNLDPGAYANALVALGAPGAPLTVGPGDLASTLSTLTLQRDIDLDGASGPIEFDKAAGSPLQNAELRCIKAGGTGTSPSGVTFDAKTGATSGTYSCL